MNLRKIIEESDTKAGRVFDLTIQALIFFSIISFCIKTIPDLSASLRGLLEHIETITIAIFTLEYLLRLYFAKNRLRFIFSFYGLVDLLAIVPFYFAGEVDLRSIRVLRLLRLFILLKIFRYNKAIHRFRVAFTLIREELIVFLTTCLFLIFIASVGIYYFERPVQPDAFASIFHAMWWAVITLTTVGYGDIYPVTVGGRLFTFVMLMIGLGVISVPAGLIAGALSQTFKDELGEQGRVDLRAKRPPEGP